MLKLNDKFQSILSTTCRYVLVTGGRGSGKSFTVSVILILMSFAAKMRALITRWTMTSAHLSIIPEFEEKLDLLKTRGNFHVTEKEITNLRSGSDILFRGIKTSSGIQTASLKSIAGVNVWVLEEGEELVDEKIFDKIDAGIRVKDSRNLIIIVMNPTTRLHWIWKRWLDKTHRIEMVDGCPVAISTHPDVCHIHVTYLDNLKNLSLSFLQMIKNMKLANHHRYSTEIIGGWLIDLEGVLYKRTDLRRYRKDDLKLFDVGPDKQQIELFEACFGYMDIADEGTDSFAFPVAHIFEKKVFITDVMFTKENTDVTLPKSLAMIDKHKIKHTRVESNNQGSMYIKALRKHLSPERVLPIHSKAKKHTRIILAEAFVKEYFYFLDPADIVPGSDYELFMNELHSYMRKEGETKKEDDAPDSISGLAKMIDSFLPHLFKP